MEVMGGGWRVVGGGLRVVSEEVERCRLACHSSPHTSPSTRRPSPSAKEIHYSLSHRRRIHDPGMQHWEQHGLAFRAGKGLRNGDHAIVELEAQRAVSSAGPGGPGNDRVRHGQLGQLLVPITCCQKAATTSREQTKRQPSPRRSSHARRTIGRGQQYQAMNAQLRRVVERQTQEHPAQRMSDKPHGLIRTRQRYQSLSKPANDGGEGFERRRIAEESRPMSLLAKDGGQPEQRKRRATEPMNQQDLHDNFGKSQKV